MPSFAVFFRDEVALGLQRVEASDAVAAEAMVQEAHPEAVLHAVDGALVTAENRHRLLASWARGL
jgi:hypothetical protein